MRDFRRAARIGLRKIDLFMNTERGCRLYYNRDLEDMINDAEDDEELEM